MTDGDFEAELQLRKRQRQDRGRRMRGWLIGVGLVVALTAAASAVFSGGPSGETIAFNIGQAIGSSFGRGLIIAGLGSLALWLVAGRRLKSTNGGRHFGILLLIAFLVGAPLSMVPLVPADGFSVSARAITDEERAALDEVMAAFAEREAALMTPPPLSTTALARPDGVRRSRAAVDEMRQIQLDRREAFLATSERVRARIAALEASPTRLAVFEVSRKEELEQMHIASAVAVEMLDKVAAQLDILAAAPGQWEIQSDQVAFARPADLEAYNRLQGEVETLNARLKTMADAAGTQSPDA